MANPKSIFWILFALSAVLLALPAVYSQDDSEVLKLCAHPTAITIGMRFTVEIPFKNLGETTWKKAEGYSLGLIDPIGTECTGSELEEEDAVASNETKRFQLSCIPLLSDINKTIMVVRMMRDEEYFGEMGTPCTYINFKVRNHCEHNAIGDRCNKYCGANVSCHNIQRNSTIDPNEPERGFCDEECMFQSVSPTTTTTLPTQVECLEGYSYEDGVCIYRPTETTMCPEGYSYEDGVCIYRPTETIVCPEDSTYSETYGGCTILLDINGLCPEGYELRADMCWYSPKTQAECPTGSTYSGERSACVFYPTSEEDCPGGYELVGKICKHIRDSELTCPEGSAYSAAAGACAMNATIVLFCPAGYRLEADVCLYSPRSTQECPENSTYSLSKDACTIYPNASQGCPPGYVLDVDICIYSPSKDLHCPPDSRYSAVARTCTVQAVPTAYCPAAFALENSLCIYLLSRTCGNLQVDDNELCDYSSDVPNWKSERSACNKNMRMSLMTCSMDCQPKYYVPRCIAGQCGAECADNSQCNDNDSKTSDMCDTSTCKCSYLLKNADNQSSSSKIKLILRVLIVFLGAVALILFAVYMRMGMRMKRQENAAAKKTGEGRVEK